MVRNYVMTDLASYIRILILMARKIFLELEKDRYCGEKTMTQRTEQQFFIKHTSQSIGS